MGVNKVIYGNTPVMDITDSTVTSQNLLSGEVAYGANGNRIIGEVTTETVIANPSGSATAGNLNKLQVGEDIYAISGGSGSGGHTILNDSGTALLQEDNLQFKGAYTHDDSINEKTIVEVTRTMTAGERT